MLTKTGQLKRNASPELKTKWFIVRAREVHGDTYNYDTLVYYKASDKVEIGCSIHGNFYQTARNHLAGRGCEKCSYIDRGLNCRGNVEDFIRESKEFHGNYYDYGAVDYKGVDVKVTIKCPEHGEFLQSPYNHKNGQGCPSCKSHKQDVLYIWRISGTDRYKIGITTQSQGIRRVKTVAASNYVNYTDLLMITTKKARELETELGDLYSCNRDLDFFCGEGKNEIFKFSDATEVYELIKSKNELLSK